MAGLCAECSAFTGTVLSHLWHGRPCRVLAVFKEYCQPEPRMSSWFWPLKMNESRRNLTDGLSSGVTTPHRLGTLSPPVTHQMALGKCLDWTSLTVSKGEGLCLAQETLGQWFSTCALGPLGGGGWVGGGGGGVKMFLLQGSPKTVGNTRYLHYNS